MKARYLGWDLDETIGSFRPGARARAVEGIRPLLESLQGRSCRHIITTSADAGYASFGLEAAGLGGLFDAVFDSSVVWKGGPGKTYLDVVRGLGMSASEAEDRFVIIGNSEIDIPADLDIVTVLNPMALSSGTRVLGAVLSALLEGSSVWWGYERMLEGCMDRYESDFFDGGRLALLGSAVFIGRVKENPFVTKAERLVCIGGPAV